MSDIREQELLQKIEAQSALIKAQASQIEELIKASKLQQERIDYLLRKLYGSKSESMEAAQILFALPDFQPPPGPAEGAERSETD